VRGHGRSALVATRATAPSSPPPKNLSKTRAAAPPRPPPSPPPPAFGRLAGGEAGAALEPAPASVLA